MLRRSKRISGQNTVEAILKKGEEQKSRLFVLKKLPSKLEENRYGIVISGKLEKSTVKRNKKRRQIYEIIRILEKEGKVAHSSPFDIVLLARRLVMDADFDRIKAAIRELIT